MRIPALLLCLGWLAATRAAAQNTIGLPEISNYAKQVYRAGAQNRMIRQDKKGVLYFANNEGVLTFDGINWKTYPLPNQSIVRCIEFGPDGRLYAGGQDEFGYFEADACGRLTYHSLRSLIPAGDRSFSDVWEIVFSGNSAFFQTSHRIFQMQDNHITVYKGEHWMFLGTLGKRLLAQDYHKGWLEYHQGTWKPFLHDAALPEGFFATGLIEMGADSGLITTHKHGVYILHGNRLQRLQTPFLESLSRQHISGAAMVNPHHIALITNLAGCYIIDKKGNLIQSFSRKEGLQNNNILDVFLDRERNLWLGLDNGIDFIAYNNAVKHIYADYLNEGSGYAAMVYQNNLYVGTSNGLYHVPLYGNGDLSFVKGHFRPVLNTQGQVWNLSEVNGRLLMGHHEGAFSVQGGAATPLVGGLGYWTFLPYENILPSALMVAGTYQGLSFFDFRAGQFHPRKETARFESARFVLIAGGDIWVAHPYKGIYRITLRNQLPQVQHYGQKAGIPSVNGNYLFRVRNRLVLSSEAGLLEYDAIRDRFEPSAYFRNLFGQKKIRYMKEDQQGNIWFVYDKVVGVMDMSEKKPRAIYFPELHNRFVSGFEHIYPLNPQNVFIGGERGFYHINYSLYKQLKYPLEAYITNVTARSGQDSVLFDGFAGPVNGRLPAEIRGASIPHAWNSFHFSFAAPVYAQQSNIEYSYYLEGFDGGWSEFSKRSGKEYTNLPAGTYVFRVKARNNLGNESAVSSYRFTVLPPWYQTLWAYLAYMALAAAGIVYVRKRIRQKLRLQQQRHEQEQRQLQYLHKLEMDSAEKQIIQLQNEKLQAEIEHKTKELASSAMHLVQKGELIGHIREQLMRLQKKAGNEQEIAELKKLLKSLNQEERVDKDWEHFAMHFDKVHTDFLSALKGSYPQLSANELKLCAYLRMNLSSKEIAQLMNISVRGVEISRYRLRKKLQLPTEVSLFDFLMNLEVGIKN